jgi:hypothetical protein
MLQGFAIIRSHQNQKRMLDHVVSNVDRHGAIAGDDAHIEQELEGRCGVVRKFTSVAPLPSSAQRE